MKRMPTPRSRPNAARSTTSSSFTPRITTAFTFTGSRPAASAASMPASVRSSSSRRVSARNVSRRSVSSETFTRRSPASRSFAASSGSFTPFVVIARSTPSGASSSKSRGSSARIGGLTAGDPDAVEAPAVDADAGDAGQLLVGEQLGPVQPAQALLGHAVGAPEVAAVRHREPQVPHAARERVHEGGRGRHPATICAHPVADSGRIPNPDDHAGSPDPFRSRAESGIISDVPRAAREAGAGTLTKRSGHSSGRR